MNYEAKFSGEDAAPETEEDFFLSEEEMASKRRRNWIIGIAVLALLLAVAVWFAFGGGGDSAAVGAEEDAAGQAPTVTVIVPGSGSVERVITATGTIAARRELPVGVAGEGGQVARVLVEPGDWVNQGQTLAVIDQSVQSQQGRSQAAQVRVAEADARLAQSNLDRALQLVERGFISKADVDRLTATRDAANARVEVARATLSELQARTRRLNITSPAAGLVLERNVEPGQVVGAGSGVLFRLARGGEMELLAELSESDLSLLSTGVQATVTPVGTDQSFTGQVWQQSPVINPDTRQGVARIALAYDPALRPGGFATARIQAGAKTGSVLPESSVQSDNKGSYVYIINADNEVERKDIVIESITADGISLKSGLNGNERVVLYAAGFLNPGETVNPKRFKQGQ